MGVTGMGEHLPYFENHVKLSKDKKDQWGMPLLEIDCEFKQNEENMTKDILQTGKLPFLLKKGQEIHHASM